MEKLILKFLIINDNPELIENRLNKILQENEQYGSIFDLQIKGITGSEFDIEIRQEISFKYYDIIILGYSFITNPDEYLSKHRFFEKIKNDGIVYKQENPNWSIFDKDMLEIFYEKRTGVETIILKENGGSYPPTEQKAPELDLKPINRYIPPEKDGGSYPPSEEADKKAKEEADKKVKEEIKDGGNLPPSEKVQQEILDETSEFLEEQEKIFAIFQNEKRQKKEIPPKKINQEKKEEYEEIKKEFTLTEEEILKVLNPEKEESDKNTDKEKEQAIIERRISIPVEEEIKEDGGSYPPSEEVEEESEEQGKTSKKRELGINLPKFIKNEKKNGGNLPPTEEIQEQRKEDIGKSLYPEEEFLDKDSATEKKKGFTLPSFGLKNISMKDGGNLPPKELKFSGDIGFFGNDRGVGTTFISFTLSKALSKTNTVAFIDMTGRSYKKILELKEKNVIDFDIYNKDNYIDAYRKNTDIKIFDFGEIDLNSELYFAEFERCNLKFLVGAEDDLKIFSMNKNYHYSEKNPDFYTVINFKEETEEKQLQKEYKGLNIVTIPFLKENIDDILKLIR